MLAAHDVAFRRTHDLTELGRQCAMVDDSLEDVLIEAANLTEYAVVFRYLDAPREPDSAEAEAARQTARHLFDRIAGLLNRAIEAELCH